MSTKYDLNETVLDMLLANEWSSMSNKRVEYKIELDEITAKILDRIVEKMFTSEYLFPRHFVEKNLPKLRAYLILDMLEAYAAMHPHIYRAAVFEVMKEIEKKLKAQLQIASP